MEENWLMDATRVTSFIDGGLFGVGVFMYSLIGMPIKGMDKPEVKKSISVQHSYQLFSGNF